MFRLKVSEDACVKIYGIFTINLALRKSMRYFTVLKRPSPMSCIKLTVYCTLKVQNGPLETEGKSKSGRILITNV